VSSTKTAQWYVKVKGKTHGPFSSGQLKKLAQKSQVQPDTPLRRGDTGKWSVAGKVKGLFPDPAKDANAASSSQSPTSTGSSQPVPAEPQVMEPEVMELEVMEPESQDAEVDNLELMDLEVMDLEVMDAEVGGLELAERDSIGFEDDLRLEPAEGEARATDDDKIWPEANPYEAQEQHCPNCGSPVATQLSVCPQCACNIRSGAVPVESTRRRRPDDVPTVVSVYSHVLRWFYVIGGAMNVIWLLTLLTAALFAGEGGVAVVVLVFIALQCLVTLILYRLALALDEGNALAVVALGIFGALLFISGVFFFWVGAIGFGLGALATFAIFYAPPLFSAITHWRAFVFTWD
jgi:hypothetical protein